MLDYEQCRVRGFPLCCLHLLLVWWLQKHLPRNKTTRMDAHNSLLTLQQAALLLHQLASSDPIDGTDQFPGTDQCPWSGARRALTTRRWRPQAPVLRPWFDSAGDVLWGLGRLQQARDSPGNYMWSPPLLLWGTLGRRSVPGWLRRRRLAPEGRRGCSRPLTNRFVLTPSLSPLIGLCWSY